MKRILSLLLAVVMLLSLAACGAKETGDGEPTPTENIETAPGQGDDFAESALPAVGDTVEGFTVTDVRPFPLVGATVVYFEHERTGARLMYIANSDTNRVFDLTFFTRAIDNTGLPHVFEHSTLDGSEKYPSKALFFNLSYQTYNTYMNAMTGSLYTTYPVASLSEEQLLKYADYYTDSCLNPTIMTDESIFREEAWRYRLSGADDELTIEGTVYSEMLGARTLASSAYTNMLRTSFPGSTIGNVSGGEPESIPDMTWESLREYHDRYYHPSNCMAFLYGQFDDYTAFLKLLDEAFAPYEKREFDFTDAGWTPLEESTTQSFSFPVEEGSGTDNASVIFYAFMCPGLKDDPQEELVLNTLTDLMVADGSPLMQNLKKALPSGSFATYIELDGPEDMIVFYAQNVDPEDADTFRSTVDASLAEMARNGFSDELVDSIKASLAISTKLMGEDPSELGVDLISSIVSYQASSNQPFGYMDYVEALDKIEDWNAQGLYVEAINEWLLGCEVTALTVTYPEAGLREQLDAAERERLAGVKAGMSEEELQAIINMSAAEDEEDDASEYVRALQAVTVSSLPEEQRSYEVSDVTGDDGVRYINAAAGVDGVGQTVLLLDASGLPQEDIHWFALYTALVGELDTSSHSRDELALLTSRYLYSGEVRLSLMDKYGTDEFRPNLRAGWIATDEDLAAGYDLMYELLFDTDFSDTEVLSGLISQNKAGLKSSITASPYSTMLYRAFGYYSPLYRYYSYFNGIEYYSFLEEVEEMMASDPAAVTAKLESVQSYFHNRSNAVALYAGSEEGIAVNAPLAEGFMAKLAQEPIEPVAYELPQPAKSEALIVDSNVQYNGVVADFTTMGMDGYSGDLDAVSSLLSDAYLYPKLRDQYGAYGVMTGFVQDAGCYVMSYRDPNVTETFEVYEGISGFIGGVEQDQEELDGYILSSYSGYAMPSGELSGAVSAAICSLTGEPQELELGYMRDLKSLDPETAKGYAGAYEKLVEDGVRFTAGGAGAINANSELYDAILNPFGSVDSSEVEFEDLPEDSEHYETVRFMYENLVMFPVEPNRFGVDDDATYGDVAIMLYVLGIGDTSDPQEAADTLAQYGIYPAGTDVSTPITGKDADSVFTAFGSAIGQPHKINRNASASVVTRGELAEQFLDYLYELGVVEDD